MKTTYNITGMTCSHCAAAVTEEISELPEASRVDVDLAAGTATVEGDVTDAQVRAAVEEAGYRVAD